MSFIVFNNGEELRPEEAIVRLAQQLSALQQRADLQDNEISRLQERVTWFESQGL